LSSVFSCVPVGTDLDGNGIPDTLLAALNYNGGDNLIGAKRILLRAAVASLLNTCAFPNGDFGAPACPDTPSQVVAEVCSVWSTTRVAILREATRLDTCNNSRFCPLN
jgi:hypothetical protein